MLRRTIAVAKLNKTTNPHARKRRKRSVYTAPTRVGIYTMGYAAELRLLIH